SRPGPTASIRRCRVTDRIPAMPSMKKLTVFLSAALLAGAAGAADLLQVYRLALDNDPQFLAARHLADAGREKEAQGLAGLLPTLGASANTQWNDLRRDVNGMAAAKAGYNSHGYTVTLSQPVFRWQNVVAWQQGKTQAVQAETQFAQ